MKFNNIKNFLILGGSLNSIDFCKFLKSKKENYFLFINKRQSKEIYNHKKLSELLKISKINHIITENINTNSTFLKYKSTNSLILGFGEPWKLDKKILKKFSNHALDFMGVPLPYYRGGAHYTWMILNQNYLGGAFIQNITENTKQGQDDSNEYFYGKYYNYPKKLKTPMDFFNYSSAQEISFLKTFYKKIKRKHIFSLKKFNKAKSLLFPRLLSKKNAFINWSHSDTEIINFINAFDEPYDGAQTFLGSKKVYIKNIIKFKDKKFSFGQFSRGLVLHKHNNIIYIALSDCIITTNVVLDRKKKNIVENIKIGQRLYTPQKYIDLSMIYLRDDI